MLEIDPLPFGCRGTCLPHKSSSRKGAGARREVPHRLCTSRAVKIKLLCMSKGPRVVKFSCVWTVYFDCTVQSQLISITHKKTSRPC